jgi:hypothetical protein
MELSDGGMILGMELHIWEIFLLMSVQLLWQLP